MTIARFEKVSLNQFEKDCLSLLESDASGYDDIKIPVRATSGSAGYDFYCPFDVTLNPKETIKIPSGIRCFIETGYVLNIYPRSSLGFKYQLGLMNSVGIIDSDYYYADNEGHIIIALVNNGDKTIEIKKGDRFVQGIFLKYHLAHEEENTNERHGGFGSTD